jgi:hypothetical protein
MNADKAKEHFSAYYEGTLDRGLRQSFELRLKSDASVQAEYRAFEKTMQELEKLSAPVPEPEFDLHEMISARLDRHIYENKAKPAVSLFGRRRPWIVAGVCAVAILGAALQIGGRSNDASQGSFLDRVIQLFVPNRDPKVGDQLSVTMRGGVPTLLVVTGEQRTVTVKSVATGKVLRTEKLDGSGLPAGAKMRSVLSYDSAKPTLLEVQMSGVGTKWLIALPGSEALSSLSGRGAIRDFALALAGHYGVVVVIAKEGPDALNWALKGDAVASATETLKGTDYSIDQRLTGVVWIQ